MRTCLLLVLLLPGCLVDADGDGFDAAADCDDQDTAIHPDAREWCDGVDNDCDGDVDEPTAGDADPYWVDADGDGYGDPDHLAKACTHPSGWADNSSDCDDTDEDVHPGAEEIPGNDVDDDCDPSTPD